MFYNFDDLFPEAKIENARLLEMVNNQRNHYPGKALDFEKYYKGKQIRIRFIKSRGCSRIYTIFLVNGKKIRVSLSRNDAGRFRLFHGLKR